MGAALKRGIEFFEKFPRGKAFYIRDTRSPFPESSRWPETNKVRMQFESMGGRLLFFDKTQAAAWYALALLGYCIKEGDVTITDSSFSTRPARWDEFVAVASEILHKESHEAFRNFDEALIREKTRPDKTGMRPGDLEVADKCFEMLRMTGGMMMITIDKLVENLNGNGFQVDKKQVLSAVSGFPDRFEIVPAKDSAIVLLKKDWLYAQH